MPASTTSDNMPRVLIFKGLGYGLGGVESYLNTLLASLVELGVNDCSCAVAVDIDHAQKTLLEGIGISTIEGHVLYKAAGKNLFERLSEKTRIRSFFREVLAHNSFDVVHVNVTAPWMQHMALHEAKLAGVPIRIAHGHGDLRGESLRGRITHAIYLHTIARDATLMLACSSAAGRYLYGNKLWESCGHVAKNGIDTKQFAFDHKIRSEVRGDLGNCLVLGSIARLSSEKNQAFLVDVLREVLDSGIEARLWLVGDGPSREEIRLRACDYGVADKVVFLGMRNDVPRILQGMDVFLLPSFSEGLPVSLVEAQASGVPCVVSTNVTDEVDIPGCPITHLPVTSPAQDWAAEALAMRGKRIEDGARLVAEAGYDSYDCALQMMAWYRGFDSTTS